MYKVFIDGSAGTTGIRIYDRLNERKDIELVSLSEKDRKDVASRKEAINSADIAFLCLPDAAAVEAVELCDNKNTVIIDTSTAHRTNDAWSYGFPEISDYYERIKSSKRIANPGCHASGFIALVQPLIKSGIMKKDIKLSCFSITGYSGGGKKMIADYEDSTKNESLKAPRQYGLSQSHKHIPEMCKVCEIENAPIFSPIVSSFYSGMEVTVPIFASDIKGNINDIRNLYRALYTGKIVHYDENCDEEGFLSSSALLGRDDMQISVFGNDERILLCARYDNLGKGASGAAIQNMNIVIGEKETTGLVV